MSNPITSVPEPEQASASGSVNKDSPLASVITQVSPSGTRSKGPARPTKVVKTSEKKKKQSTPDNNGDAASFEKAQKSSSNTQQEVSLQVNKKADDITPEGGNDRGEESSHTQKPSSTLIGTTTSKGSALTPSESAEGTGLTKDKPSDAASTPTEPDPLVNSAGTEQGKILKKTQDKATTSERVNTSRKNAKGENLSLSGSKTAGAPSDYSRNSAERGEKKKKPRKRHLTRRIVAALTCSALGGSALMSEEELNEKNATKQENKRQKAKKRASSKNENSSTRGSLPSSRRTSTEKLGTVSGGTRLPRDETGDVMSGAVVPPGSSFVVQEGESRKGGSASTSQKDVEEDVEEGEGDDWTGEDQLEDDEEQTEEQRLIMQGGAGIPRDENGDPHPLLEPIIPQDDGRKCLVLDLDETLVHSSFKMISNADFIVPVEIEGSVHNVYVIKRPGVDEFMRRMGEIYEVVVFTASLSKYADPVLDILDIHHVVRHRLFRESCYNHRGNYVKDLSQLGREIETSIIIDNSPASYIFHPNNAVPISSWFNDPHDTELTDLCPFLAELAEVDDVRAVLDGGL